MKMRLEALARSRSGVGKASALAVLFDPATPAKESFDPLMPGFHDWGTWWQGEIAGEYKVNAVEQAFGRTKTFVYGMAYIGYSY